MFIRVLVNAWPTLGTSYLVLDTKRGPIGPKMCQRSWEQVGLPSFMDLAAVDYLRVQANTSHCLVQGQDTRCKGHGLGPTARAHSQISWDLGQDLDWWPKVMGNSRAPRPSTPSASRAVHGLQSYSSGKEHGPCVPGPQLGKFGHALRLRALTGAV